MGADLVRGINFSNSFNLGTDVPNKITPNVDGTSIVRDPVTGVLSSPAAASGLLVVIGYLNVNTDGSIAASGGGATATRTAVGRYDVTPPPGTISVIATVFESETIRDAVAGHFTDLTFTRFWIGEGDNGGTAAVPRDRSWSCQMLGAPTP